MKLGGRKLDSFFSFFSLQAVLDLWVWLMMSLIGKLRHVWETKNKNKKKTLSFSAWLKLIINAERFTGFHCHLVDDHRWWIACLPARWFNFLCYGNDTMWLFCFFGSKKNDHHCLVGHGCRNCVVYGLFVVFSRFWNTYRNNKKNIKKKKPLAPELIIKLLFILHHHVKSLKIIIQLIFSKAGPYKISILGFNFFLFPHIFPLNETHQRNSQSYLLLHYDF